jgi:hypothetical protein
MKAAESEAKDEGEDPIKKELEAKNKEIIDLKVRPRISQATPFTN